MACTHPHGVQVLRDVDGNVAAIRCPICKRVSVVRPDRPERPRRWWQFWR